MIFSPPSSKTALLILLLNQILLKLLRLKKKAKRESNVQKSHTAEFWTKIIYKMQFRITKDILADRCGINQSIPARNTENTNATASKKSKKFLKKDRKSVKYLEIYKPMFKLLSISTPSNLCFLLFQILFCPIFAQTFSCLCSETKR